jgi:hypothetical protein
MSCETARPVNDKVNDKVHDGGTCYLMWVGVQQERYCAQIETVNLSDESLAGRVRQREDGSHADPSYATLEPCCVVCGFHLFRLFDFQIIENI